MEMYWIEIGGFVLLLMASCFFAGAETAVTGASQARMIALQEDGDERAGLVLKLRERKEQVISSLLLGNTFSNIFASALATAALLPVLGEQGVAAAMILISVIVFVVAEVMPKTYAIANANDTALRLAAPLRFVVALFAPVTITVGRLVAWLFKLFGLDTRGISDNAHEEELRGAIELFKGGEQEKAEKATGTMLSSIIELAELQVEEIMIHRRNVNMINVDVPMAQIVDEVLHSAYTRIPVWKGSHDNIIGVINTKLLLQELRRCNGDTTKMDIYNAMMEPWFIPESTTLFDQLQAFRRRREHFAIMVDEYGVVTGVVTMEDILEEIVGQIEDEHDTVVAGVSPHEDGSCTLDGKVTIRDLNRELGWKLPDEEYSTLAGLLLFETQRIPAVGQVFTFFDYRFEVLKKQRNQLTLVRVIPPPPVEAALQAKEVHA